MKDRFQFVEQGAIHVRLFIYHDSRDGLPLIGSHDLCFSMGAGETFLQRNCRHVPGKSLTRSGEVGIVIPGKREVVGVAGVASASGSRQSGEASIEPKRDRIRKRGRGRRPLRQVRETESLFRFPGHVPTGSQHGLGRAMTAETGQQPSDFLGIARRTKKRRHPRLPDAGKKVGDVHAENEKPTDVRFGEAADGTSGTKAVRRIVKRNASDQFIQQFSLDRFQERLGRLDQPIRPATFRNPAAMIVSPGVRPMLVIATTSRQPIEFGGRHTEPFREITDGGELIGQAGPAKFRRIGYARLKRSRSDDPCSKSPDQTLEGGRLAQCFRKLVGRGLRSRLRENLSQLFRQRKFVRPLFGQGPSDRVTRRDFSPRPLRQNGGDQSGRDVSKLGQALFIGISRDHGPPTSHSDCLSETQNHRKQQWRHRSDESGPRRRVGRQDWRPFRRGRCGSE